MKISYFAIYDDKGQSFGQMFPSQTLGTAERAFQESLNNPESIHAKHPEDFSLYHILDLDDDTGHVLESFEPPNLVVRATQLVE